MVYPLVMMPSVLPRSGATWPSRTLFRIATVLLLAIVCWAGRAESADTASSPLKQTIIVGGDRDYPPYEFIDQNGHPAGYNVELTRAIANVMGFRVEFRLGSWSEMRKALQDGTVDVLEGMSWSQEREREVEFSTPHTLVNHAIFARKNSPMVTPLPTLPARG